MLLENPIEGADTILIANEKINVLKWARAFKCACGSQSFSWSNY